MGKLKNAKIGDYGEIRVGGSELAQWLGVSMSAITGMRTAGKLTQGEDGKYNLKDEVLRYISELKERKSKREGGSIEEETAFWKLQNLKQKNRDWRQQRDRMVATEICKALIATLQELKGSATDAPRVVEAIDATIKAVDAIDVDLISMAVEGETEDDE